jgi:hypothetical protein
MTPATLPDPARRLLPRHRNELYGSGLSDDQIDACGFYSVETPTPLRTILNWTGSGSVEQHLPALAIPFRQADGSFNGFTRLKPNRPRVKDGRLVKYESPVNAGNRAYLPPGTIAALADPGTALLVTEGEKKAAKADQEGFPCVGLVGVYGWQKRWPKDKDGKPTRCQHTLAL